MFSFRPAVVADVPALAQVAQLAYAPYADRMGQRPAPMTADYDAIVARGEVWVAEDNRHVLGMLVLNAEPGYLLVENVAVVPEAQGQGVGKALMRLAEDRAAASGLAELRLYTNAAMTENLTYYPRHGYVETHRGEEGGFQRVFFRKRIASLRRQVGHPGSGPPGPLKCRPGRFHWPLRPSLPGRPVPLAAALVAAGRARLR